MNQTIRFLIVLVTSLAVQLPMLESKIYAQTITEGNESFLMRQNMAIDERFQYFELKVDRQQKEQWSRELFMADVSHTMKIENIQAIELTEADFANNRSNNGIRLIEF